MKKIYLLPLLTSTFLIACGGEKSTNNTIVQTNIPTSAKIVVMENIIKQNQSADLVLFVPNDDISSISWSQTSGTPITLLAKTSKVVSFSTMIAGEYSFSVSFNDGNGNNHTLAQAITVTSELSPMSLRKSHAVVEQNAVSLSAYFDDDVDTDSISWKQVAGPTVAFSDVDTNGKFSVFFDAPTVTNDTILEFELSLNHNDQTYTDKLAVLVENSDVPVLSTNDAYFKDNRLATVYPYNKNSPVADVLADCVYSNKLKINSNACNFTTIPLIAHITKTPTVDDIMDRVLVSHQWMGDRFKTFLETFDTENNDFKNLLRATTAIVISYDIRPSFYQAYTGAIYLDPDDLWLTPDERDTINQAPDYRASFGSDLQFEMPWRYVKNNDYASFYPNIKYRLSRDIEDTLYSFSSLLYHELAHANDYFPSTSWDNINRTSKIELVAYNRIINASIQSDDLQSILPLNGNEMRELAKVRFHNDPPVTNTQKAYTPEDVAHFFEREAAPQFYNYSSTREDYAMLFDGFMMSVRYNVQRDVMVIDKEEKNITWGQRGREAEADIKPRIKFVVENVLPEFENLSATLNALPAPILMPVGEYYRDTLLLNLPVKNSIANQLLQQNKKHDSRYRPVLGRQFDPNHLPKIINVK